MNKKAILTALSLALAVSPMRVFGDNTILPTDFESTPKYAQGTIKEMYQSGKINGYSDGTFKPKQLITRTEFLAMILSNGEYQEKRAGVEFSEKLTQFQRKVLDKAYKANLLSGSGYDKEGKLITNPNAYITRQEMASIIMRAYGQKYSNTASLVGDDIIFSYSDVNDISKWASPAIYEALALGLMSGTSNNKISPKGQGTRAEAAILAYRLNKVLNEVPLVFDYVEGQSFKEAIIANEEKYKGKTLYSRLFIEQFDVLLENRIVDSFVKADTSESETDFNINFLVEVVNENDETEYIEIYPMSNFNDTLGNNNDITRFNGRDSIIYDVNPLVTLETLIEHLKENESSLKFDNYRILLEGDIPSYDVPLSDEHVILYYNNDYTIQGELEKRK